MAATVAVESVITEHYNDQVLLVIQSGLKTRTGIPNSIPILNILLLQFRAIMIAILVAILFGFYAVNPNISTNYIDRVLLNFSVRLAQGLISKGER